MDTAQYMPHTARKQGAHTARLREYLTDVTTRDTKSSLPQDLRRVLAAALDRLMEGKVALRHVKGISASQLGRIRRRESAATIDALQAIADAFSIHAWELLYEGSPKTERATNDTSQPAIQLTAEERQLVARYKMLQEKERAMLMELADALVLKRKSVRGKHPYPTAKKPGP